VPDVPEHECEPDKPAKAHGREGEHDARGADRSEREENSIACLVGRECLEVGIGCGVENTGKVSL
jgi:hypothetical protein